MNIISFLFHKNFPALFLSTLYSIVYNNILFKGFAEEAYTSTHQTHSLQYVLSDNHPVFIDTSLCTIIFRTLSGSMTVLLSQFIRREQSDPCIRKFFLRRLFWNTLSCIGRDQNAAWWINCTLYITIQWNCKDFQRPGLADRLYDRTPACHCFH